jgi:hypothetical protein
MLRSGGNCRQGTGDFSDAPDVRDSQTPNLICFSVFEDIIPISHLHCNLYEYWIQ